MLSQMCLIRTNACWLSVPASLSVSSLRFPTTIHAQPRQIFFNHLETVTSHGQGSSSSLSSSDPVSQPKPQAEGMDINEEKANDPHNPPMEAEEIVSVLDREFCLGCPPPYPSHVAHPFLILQMTLSLPNTCLISAMTLRNSRSFIGSSRAGRNSTRN